jgi:ribose transport system substrate-binding protein
MNKMHRKKFVLATAAALILVLAIAVCASPAESEKKQFIIGFANGFSGNSWRTMMLASLEQELAKYPDVILSVVDGQNDISKQVNDIQSLIAKNVDGIMVIPNSAEAIEPVLIEARQRGIKVCVFNLPVTDPNAYDIFLGTDAVAKGKANGDWLVKKLNGKGKIIAFGGIAGNAYTAAGLEGLNQAIAGTEVEILTYRDCDWAEDKAKMVMTDLLGAYKEIDGIWADGGQMACGALKAMQDAGRPLIPVTGDDYNGLLKLYDANKDKEPNLDFNSLSEPSWESREAFKLLYTLLKGEAVEKDVTIMPAPINSSNYSQFIKRDMPDTLFADNDLPQEVLANLIQ